MNKRQKKKWYKKIDEKYGEAVMDVGRLYLWMVKGHVWTLIRHDGAVIERLV